MLPIHSPDRKHGQWEGNRSGVEKACILGSRYETHQIKAQPFSPCQWPTCPSTVNIFTWMTKNASLFRARDLSRFYDTNIWRHPRGYLGDFFVTKGNCWELIGRGVTYLTIQVRMEVFMSLRCSSNIYASLNSLARLTNVNPICTMTNQYRMTDNLLNSVLKQAPPK
jgi:hypothetical protein